MSARDELAQVIYTVTTDRTFFDHVELAEAILAAGYSKPVVSPERLYRFKGRATGRDPEGYYYVRWDRAQPISVLAETRQEATNKAFALLGIHPRFGSEWRKISGWTLIWDSVDEEVQ